MRITGKNISLTSYTRELCHDFYKSYISDELMTCKEFIYDREKVDKYYDTKINDQSRYLFAILLNDNIIGEIQIKNINYKTGTGTLSIILLDDKVKNKGYGSEAIKLILNYAENDLRLCKVLADTVHRNSRSRHVLEKTGFQHIYDDEEFNYFEYII